MATYRKHWSYSALQQYLKCPLQYYFERVLKLPKPSVSGGLVLGSAVHAALADYHLSLKRGSPTSIDRLLKSLQAKWALQEAEQTIEYRSGENRVVLLAIGISLLETYLKEPPPNEIVGVEEELLVPLINSEGEYLETPLVAIVDLVSRESGKLRIREFKTSSRAYGQSEVDLSLQATCYANAAWHTFDEWPEIEFAVLTKTKTPRLQRVETVRTESDLGRLGDIAQNVERAVEQAIFFPIESPLNCSTCPFREPCRNWKPDRTNNCENRELTILNGYAH